MVLNIVVRLRGQKPFDTITGSVIRACYCNIGIMCPVYSS